jgi:elongation factor Tu
MIMPGDHAEVEVTLMRRMPFLPTQTFTIRENKTTVATGRVIESLPSVDVPKQSLGALDFSKSSKTK